MGIFGTRKVPCSAGVWTAVIANAFVQLPAGFHVRVTTTGGDPVEGIYEEKRSRWIFPGKPVRGALAASMTFERGYFNTFYSVKVCPTTDCIVEVD